MSRSQSLARQSTRYLLVGTCVYVVDFATYAALLLAWPAAYLGANVAGKGVGAALGFILHRRFTFSLPPGGRQIRQACSYAALFVTNLALSNLLLWLLVGGLGGNALVARLATDIVVVTGSFLISRHWVFR